MRKSKAITLAIMVLFVCPVMLAVVSLVVIDARKEIEACKQGQHTWRFHKISGNYRIEKCYHCRGVYRGTAIPTITAEGKSE